MIAAVVRWHAVFSAFLFFIAWSARASEDSNGAARELARKTAALVSRGDAVSVTWHNVSSLGSSDVAQIRAAFETALQETGARASAAGYPVTLTLSETPSQYLLVEEAQAGDERRVWIAGWKRSGHPNIAAQGVSLESKLVWEQDEQILDVAFPGNSMLVLSVAHVAVYDRANGGWQLRQSKPLPSIRPLPRDPRGHLRLNGGFQAFLPGATCNGTVDPSLSISCQPADDPWVLDSGSRSLLLANFNASRNYFDGRVVTQSGVRKQTPPFFSVAASEEQGRSLWLAATLDGRVQILSNSLEPIGSFSGWGSDIAGTSARCGGGSQILATRPGDGTEPDSIQAFTIVERSPAPLASPLAMTGPVTALWLSNPSQALAVVRDPASGKYAAYLISIVCGG